MNTRARLAGRVEARASHNEFYIACWCSIDPSQCFFLLLLLSQITALSSSIPSQTGVGTRISNGCTSGHGLCGLARLAPRSFVAVGSFMFSGIFVATAFPAWSNPAGTFSNTLLLRHP